jgi:hypothetical protein
MWAGFLVNPRRSSGGAPHHWLFSLLFPKNTSGDPARAAGILGFCRLPQQNNSQNLRCFSLISKTTGDLSPGFGNYIGNIASYYRNYHPRRPKLVFGSVCWLIGLSGTGEWDLLRGTPRADPIDYRVPRKTLLAASASAGEMSLARSNSEMT